MISTWTQESGGGVPCIENLTLSNADIIIIMFQEIYIKNK